MSRHQHHSAVVAAAFCVAAAGAVMTFAASALAQTGPQLVKGQAAAPRSLTLSDLPIATASSGLTVMPRPRSPVSDSEFAALKAQAAGRRGTATAGTGATTPLLSPSRETPGAMINFDGDFQNEANCGDTAPADTALAVGDGNNPILQAVNFCASVWNPAGARLAGPVTLQAMFALPAGTSVSGPRALYDWYNHRFMIVAADTDHASSNNYDIAVSKTDDPAGGYWIYRIPVQSALNATGDFLRLGQDHTATYPVSSGTAYPGAIYLVANLFANPGGAFLWEEWLILPKSAMYNGQTFSIVTLSHIKNPDTTFAYFTQPANVWSPFDIPRAEYFLESIYYGGQQLIAFAVSNPFGWASGGPDPEFSSVPFNTVNSYALPPFANQPGGNYPIDTGSKTNLSQVTYNAGYLHAALTSVTGSGGSGAIIYKVRPSLNVGDSRCATAACPQITAASIEDESVRSYGPNSAYYPTPVPNFEGNVTTVFNFSGDAGPCATATTGCYPSLAYDSQRVDGGVGFTDSGVYLMPGTALYTQGLWGRYTAVAPVAVGYQVGLTPGRPGFAFSGMYAGPGNCTGSGSGCWFTRIGYTQFNAANQP